MVLLTVLEFLASFMSLSATLMSSWMESVSLYLREFKWSWTFTHILSIIWRWYGNKQNKNT